MARNIIARLALVSLCCLLFFFEPTYGQEDFPFTVNISVIQGSEGTCPNEQLLRENRQYVQSLLESVISKLGTSVPQCQCMSGRSRRIAYLNMNNTNHECPTGWMEITTPRRACGRPDLGPSCRSVYYPANGFSYSHVCGRVIAYQYCDTGAFDRYNVNSATTIESYYVDGVSVTHGSPRQHIWTFAAAFSDSTTGISVCPCTRGETTIQIPPYVGNDYFCDSSYETYPSGCGQLPSFFDDDPLWDGAGCDRHSTCCQFNNPPWFCKQLPQATTDDVEVRICGDRGIDIDDNPIELIEIYVS